MRSRLLVRLLTTSLKKNKSCKLEVSEMTAVRLEPQQLYVNTINDLWIIFVVATRVKMSYFSKSQNTNCIIVAFMIVFVCILWSNSKIASTNNPIGQTSCEGLATKKKMNTK